MLKISFFSSLDSLVGIFLALCVSLGFCLTVAFWETFTLGFFFLDTALVFVSQKEVQAGDLCQLSASALQEILWDCL